MNDKHWMEHAHLVLSIQARTDVIEIRLRQMMQAYTARTGERLTYEALAERTGLARSTIESIATRSGYNASLATIERICIALHCAPGDLLKLKKTTSSSAG